MLTKRKVVLEYQGADINSDLGKIIMNLLESNVGFLGNIEYSFENSSNHGFKV